MSQDIEPRVYRQRIIVEGHYTIAFDGDVMKTYLQKLSEEIDMRIFAGPFCYPPDRWNDPDGIPLQDWNGFVMWLESGCHCYAFPKVKFFTVDAYSCKPFDAQKVADFTKQYFDSDDMQFREV
jgi:S-adenosylmethionine/arginine decarboxylase-like enzyme